jgi:copper(I)-binding protein
MTSLLGPVLAILLAASVTTEPAPGMAVGSIRTDHGAVYEIKTAGTATQGFVTIVNDGDTPDKLSGWACPIADTTDLAGPDGKSLPALDIPARQSVTLDAGGPHLTLTGTHFPITRGSVIPCTLTFDNAGDIQVLLFADPMPKT